MKKLITALTLFVLALGFTLVAAQQNKTTQVAVTPQTVANRSAAKPYVLDLSRGGTIYNIAKGVDFGRVRIRTSQSELPMSELTQNHPGAGRWVLGMGVDIKAQILDPGSRKVSTGGGGGSEGFVNCDAGINTSCHCSGWRDCIGLAMGKPSCEIWSCSFPDAPADPLPYCTCSSPKKLN